jgi:hypothetical protein
MFDFNFDLKPNEEIPKIKQSDFIKLAKKVLSNIQNSHYGSWENRALAEGEFPDESICDRCKGCGEFKALNGDILECRQNNQDGFCYHRYFDAEELGISVEAELDSIHNLLESEVIPD